jgi:hypothetical protein
VAAVGQLAAEAAAHAERDPQALAAADPAEADPTGRRLGVGVHLVARGRSRTGSAPRGWSKTNELGSRHHRGAAERRPPPRGAPSAPDGRSPTQTWIDRTGTSDSQRPHPHPHVGLERRAPSPSGLVKTRPVAAHVHPRRRRRRSRPAGPATTTNRRQEESHGAKYHASPLGR